jgi:Uma2 family endonuclease
MTELAQGPLIALQADGIEIPPGILDMARFRSWVHSGSFPERGRIDWVTGRMEVDMSPEDLNTHGSPKSAIAVQLGNLIQETGRGLVFIDRARFSSPAADLSVEPDILVILVKTLEAGRARLVPKASGAEGRFVEIEGTVDLAVECVSDASTVKDRKRLREAYHRSGVTEYWLVDAREESIEFQILLHAENGYKPAAPDKKGFVRSDVLGRKVRLVVVRREAGLVFYRLEAGKGKK